jgi:hypothetical protein
MNKSELTEDKLYELVKSCDSIECGGYYRITGSNEEVIWLEAWDGDEIMVTFAELLEDIQKSKHPAKFFKKVTEAEYD